MNKKKYQLSRSLLLNIVTVALSSVATVMLLKWMLLNIGNAEPPKITGINVADRVDKAVGESMDISFNSQAQTHGRFTLSDNTIVAPKPNPACYGQTDAPNTLPWLLEDAKELLGGQKTLFSAETMVKEGSIVSYYLDETILAITWKQVVDDGVYTFSEVKIGHPSQFRRFLADNQFGSQKRYTTTEMAQTVNAVVGASGDYYGYRSIGIVVNNGQIFRDRGQLLDTCYIDDSGDLLFTYAGEISDADILKRYIEDHHIRFSLSFGPVMIENGANCVPANYNSGEINRDYARAALCQLGKLHYLIVAVNMENPYLSVPTVHEFAENLVHMGIPKAYALDGGQTATIAMNCQLMNKVSYGSQRRISDIIYFATAVPESMN